MQRVILVLTVFCWGICESSPPIYQGISIPGQDSYQLPSLRYDVDGLEPYIDARTVQVHHEGHVNNYRTKMNGVLEAWRENAPTSELNKLSLIGILRNLDAIPDAYKQGVINNAGGFVNHLIYWAVMSPNPEGTEREPEGKILEDINKNFGSFTELKEQFDRKAMQLFGSGYVWLCRIKGNPNKLTLLQTKNQDSPVALLLDPILVIDVWEHAYYLKHQSQRAAYLQDWWKLVDWQQVTSLDKWWQETNKNVKDEL